MRDENTVEALRKRHNEIQEMAVTQLGIATEIKEQLVADQQLARDAAPPPVPAPDAAPPPVLAPAVAPPPVPAPAVALPPAIAPPGKRARSKSVTIADQVGGSILLPGQACRVVIV